MWTTRVRLAAFVAPNFGRGVAAAVVALLVLLVVALALTSSNPNPPLLSTPAPPTYTDAPVDASDPAYDPDLFKNRNRKALFRAAEMGDEAMARDVIRADPHSVTMPSHDFYDWNYGQLQETALHVACHFGRINVVRLLLKAGAVVNAVGTNRQTPLMWAARHGRTAIADLLLRSGADAEMQDVDGWSALHWAAEYGREKALLLLVMHVRSKRGQTPVPFVDLLTLDRATPLHLAAGGGVRRSMHLIREREQRARFTIPGHARCMRLLLGRGARVDALDVQKQAPLHYAAMAGHMAALEMLLETATGFARAGTVHNETDAVLVMRRLLLAQDVDGRTPLMLAANYGHVAALERLLAAADARHSLHDLRVDMLGVQDRFGLTALAIAQRYQQEEAVILLKEASP
jgi:ankyrin repeat protein